jgi:hypothetical protein
LSQRARFLALSCITCGRGGRSGTVDVHAAPICKDQSMGMLKRLIGRDDGETQEQYVRRMSESGVNGYVKPVLPSLVEFYDRIATLEAQVAALQSKSQ